MVVGLTGGIGSGKTTVLKHFKALGNIAVYIADEEAKKLMNSSEEIKSKIITNFGKDAYLNNELNRPFIADIVFNDKEKLALINAIVHPEVYKHFNAFVEEHHYKDYILYENAILFENKSDVFCDVIITVYADKPTRIARVVKRDGKSSEEVESRMNNQWSDIKKCLLSNYIIENNEVNSLENQIVRIHNNLTKNKAAI